MNKSHEYVRGDFCTYVSQFVVSKGMEFSHTSFIKPTRSFYIDVDSLPSFMEHYKRAMKNGEDLYMTEKHRDVSPVLIDMDFRFDKKTFVKRTYTYDMIKEVVSTYVSTLKEYVEFPESIDVYIMEKSNPVADTKYYKDGVHIVIPQIVTKPEVQLIVRQKILPQVSDILQPLNLQNAIEDVFDEAVIERNNWQMYGSKKPNGEPYKVTHIIRVSQDTSAFEVQPVPEDHSELVDILSIRNKFVATPTKIEKEEELKAFTEQRRKPRVDMSKPMFKSNHVKNECDNIEWVAKLVDILDAKRADKYDDWIRVGWCLRNIDHRLLDKWIDFSKKSEKYTPGECEKYWNMMRDDGLGIGTLCMWVKNDNPGAYHQLIEQDLYSLVLTTVNETHYDIAKVIYFMYRYDYVCINIKNNLWYEFKNHRWLNCDAAYSLRQKISTEVFKKYLSVVGQINQKIAVETDDGRQKTLVEQSKKLLSVSLKLKQSPFKDNIIKECRELFYVEKFEEKLDSKSHLIGFENGVFDLEAMEFREGRPDDYVSMTTRINYVPYDATHECQTGINHFISTIFTKPHIKEYILKLMGSFLNGSVREEKFHIWTGSGCFAKDTKIMMIDGSSKAVQDIVEGDKLMGDDSTPRQVLQLFRGYSDMYDIIPIKGEKFTVNGQHDLVVKARNMSFVYRPNKNSSGHAVRYVEYTYNDAVFKGVTKKFMDKDSAEAFCESLKDRKNVVQYGDIIILTVHQFLKLPLYIQEFLAVYRPDMVTYPEKEVKLDPYFLGYWLGDGDSACPRFTTADPEVLEYITNYAADNNCAITINSLKGHAKTYSIIGADKRKNSIRIGLDHYKLFNNKHIPDDYKHNTESVRFNILAGILDSDGYYETRLKQFELTFKSEKLIDDVIELARSLGLSCYKYPVQKKCYNNGVVGNYFRIQICGENLHKIPTILPRKKPEPRSCPRDPLMLNFKVKRIEDDNFYGFELDGNRRFLLSDYIVSKNSNGKSALIDLFEKTFGEYCCKFPVTLLTQKRAVANAPTPEIARSKGRRFAVLQEPSEDEKMNVGLMKELTGGDKIMARHLMKEPIEFKPQFKMVLTCNHLPNVPSDDGGTWRRIRVVEFTSRFCENPSPENPNEFPIDKDLSKKFEDWKEHFMALLLEYYKKYALEGIREPDEVMKCTRDYQRSNDIIMDFIEQEIEKSPGDDRAQASLTDIFSRFQSWIKDNAPQMKNTITKKTLKAALEKTLGKVARTSGVEVFKDCKLRNNASIYDDIDEL